MEEKLLGSFCVAKAGHDRENIYIIVGSSEEFLLLADGKRKKLEKPKKKNLKHVTLTGMANEDLKNKLLANKQITNEEVKRAIKLLDI